MNNIKTLYKYLMLDLQASRSYWYKDYKKITIAINELKNKLSSDPSLKLKDETCYQGNSYFKNWDDFLSKMFANTGNGIASNGQSVFSTEMKNKALTNSSFIDSLTNLVKDSSIINHNYFASEWFQVFQKNNPVQTNRASAACNINLSSTVDEGKFNVIFDWFIKNNYVTTYSGDNNWYDKNIFLVEEIRNGLKENDSYIDFKTSDNLEIDDYWVNIFIWMAYENIANPFNLNKQLIKYGAPGTGKTYLSKQVCKLQFDIWKNTFGAQSSFVIHEHLELVQFHPTYSYEDFVEGLRPTHNNGTIQLQLKNGIFKQFCKNAAKWERDLYLIDHSKSFCEWTVNDVKTSDHKCFESDYWTYIKELDDNLKIEDVIPPYFLIIDEINRAELSAVFGELMFCLEYRGATNSIKTQYSELNTKETAIIEFQDKYKFFVPHNVYIIGTMNTIDRSVDSFDFALRRRFRWEKVRPDMDLLRVHITSINKEWIGLVENVKALNELIKNEELLGEDYQLGHAYFWNLKYSRDLSLKQLKNQIWDDRLGSLVEEYLRGSGRQDLVSNLKKKFIG